MPLFRLAILSIASTLTLSACSAPLQIQPTAPSGTPPLLPVTASAPGDTVAPEATPTAVRTALVPDFEHIAVIVFENKEFGTVIGSARMPYFNHLARSYSLLTQHYAVSHPSLPNYLALISGDTFGIDFTCTKCLYEAVTLPDLIEASGRTWKAYQEDMPMACFEGTDHGLYVMKHNPFMYFESIRVNDERCTRSVVPFTQLYADITSGTLPSFMFITPNLCHDAHDCDVQVADEWLGALMLVLQPALESDGKPYLIILTWDEGQGNHSCCGLPDKAGGRVATIIVSPQARPGFEDETPYTHYSLLKTIAEAWQLEYLGHAEDDASELITAPWK